MEILSTSDPFTSHNFSVGHSKPYSLPADAFESRVIYVRVIASLDMRDSITIVFLPRDPRASLRVNGEKMNPSMKVARTLNRHRTSASSSESVYVNTDRINFTGPLIPFEIHLQDAQILVHGMLRRGEGCISTENACMWLMDCREGEVNKIDQGLVDVCLAGTSLGRAVLLNGVVEYEKRCKGLDCLPGEDDIMTNYSKEGEEKLMDAIDGECRKPRDRDEEEEEEATWFNAGVKLGMGLGLGMCLGLGVGIGLLVRTYHATSGAIRRLI